ncbi:hypothetical protein [Chryseobacterium sp. SL1]|uniref:hypothetical protein n=1 Tax=Chryseobacterium sp. SL1 TaxID=2995159 RepID=UPI0022755B03|nr:hypothetical protein [Chryseobacterium sp. SL1]MCY1660946.1 hypothetical protein [Chryseobacterium sp. SL1]
MKTIKLFFLCLFVTISANAFSQNQWYFGLNAGLEFQGNSTIPLTGNRLRTGEGCANAYDENGKLILYTDGTEVYFINNSNQHIHLTSNRVSKLLGSSSSTHAAIIIPITCDRYAIFTVRSFLSNDTTLQRNSLFYSIVNISDHNNPRFEIQNNSVQIAYHLQNNNPNIVFSEKLAAIRKKNNNGYWLVAHDYSQNNSDANTFYVFDINANLTVNTLPDFSIHNAGSNHNDDLFYSAIGQMKFSHNGSMIALGGKNFIDVLNFTDTGNTVAITSRNTFNLNGYNYGIEFSPRNNYLYYTFYGRNEPNTRRRRPDGVIVSDPKADLSGVRRINLQTNTVEITESTIWNDRFEEDPDDYYMGLQLGPNNMLYCSIDVGKNGSGNWQDPYNSTFRNYETSLMWISDLDNPNLQSIRLNNKGSVNISGNTVFGLPTIVKNLQGCGGSSSCEVKCCLPITFSNKQMLLENRNTRIFNFQNNPVNATAAFDYIVRQDFLGLMNSHINTVNIEARGYSCPEVTFTPLLNVYRYNNTSNSIGQQQIEQAFAADRSQFTLIGAIDNFSSPNQIIAPLPTQVNHFIVEFEAKWKGIGNCSSSIFTGTTIQGGGTKANSNGGVKVPKN